MKYFNVITFNDGVPSKFGQDYNIDFEEALDLIIDRKSIYANDELDAKLKTLEVNHSFNLFSNGSWKQTTVTRVK